MLLYEIVYGEDEEDVCFAGKEEHAKEKLMHRLRQHSGSFSESFTPYIRIYKNIQGVFQMLEEVSDSRVVFKEEQGIVCN